MYVFQGIYLLTMARIWHVVGYVKLLSGSDPLVHALFNPAPLPVCSVLLNPVPASARRFLRHSLLQQPAASAPRPATRPASATKQQQPPAALATAPLPESTPPAASAARLLPPVPPAPGGCRCRTHRRSSATAPLPASTPPAASAARLGGCRGHRCPGRPAAVDAAVTVLRGSVRRPAASSRRLPRQRRRTRRHRRRPAAESAPLP